MEISRVPPLNIFSNIPHTTNPDEKLRLRSNDGIIDPWGIYGLV